MSGINLLDYLPPKPSAPADAIAWRQNLLAAQRELHRELEVRRRVYPGWVATGKLTRPLADHRIRVIEWLLTLAEAINTRLNDQAIAQSAKQGGDV